MLQWRMSLPMQNMLAQYDRVVESLASLFQPLAEAAQHQIAAATGLSSRLDPHWPHLFLVLGLQLFPRAEACPGWEAASERSFKALAASLGIVLGFSLSLLLASYPWTTGQPSLLFMLFAVTLAVFFQNRLADWPESPPSLADADLLPAFDADLADEVATGDDLRHMPRILLVVVAAFVALLIAVEASMAGDAVLIRSMELVGYAVCLGLGILVWMVIDSGDLSIVGWFLGIGSRPRSTPLTTAGRIVLLVTAIMFALGSSPESLSAFTLDYMFQSGVVALTLFALYIGQRAVLTAVPPHVELRDYPFPSALGMFLIGAALLFAVDIPLR